MEVLPPAAGSEGNADQVGAFRQGDDLSRWALGRYLIGRALAVQISRALLLLALLFAGIAVGVYFADLLVLAIFIGLVAVALLAARAILGAVLRRLTLPALSTDANRRLQSLVADTRGDVARELRRLGLPGRVWSMPLLALRLAGRRRAEVLARLRGFDIERVVPPARVDDLHLLLRATSARLGESR